MDASSPRRASVVSLPVECRQALLVCMPDISTLRSAVLSHPSLYTAFLDRRDFIIKRILSSVISSDALLAEAFSVLDSSNVEPWTRVKVHDILDRWNRHYIPTHIAMKDAIRIEKFHSSAAYFELDFAAAALSEDSVSNFD